MNNSPFNKAEKIKKKLRFVVGGFSGVGKTHFALTFPKPAVIDMERGTDLFEGRAFTFKEGEEEKKATFDFQVFHTSSFKETSEAIEWLRHDYEKVKDDIGSIIVDPYSIVWEAAQSGYIDKLDARVRAGKREDDDLQFQDWRKIKQPWKKMVNNLLNMPCHVVLVCRLDDNIVVKNGKPQTKGVKIDAEKKTFFHGDVVFFLERDEEGDSKNIIGTVKKDRWGLFEVNEKLVNPTFHHWLPIVDQTEGIVEYPSDEEASEKDGDLFEEKQQAEDKVAIIESIKKGGQVMFSRFGERGGEAYSDFIEKAQGEAEANTLAEMVVDDLEKTLVELRVLHSNMQNNDPHSGQQGKQSTTEETT